PAAEVLTRTVEQATAPVGQTVQGAERTAAPMAERVRHVAPTRERHARSVLAPVFQPVAASAPEVRPQGNSVTAKARGGTPSPRPAPGAPELPPTPSGGASAAPAGLAFAGFAALFGAAALLLVGAARTLHLTPVAVRPAPFISLLERPG